MLINYRIPFHLNLVLRMISQLNRSQQMNENKHSSCELLPRILSPKYGQTANVILLIANRGLPFVVR